MTKHFVILIFLIAGICCGLHAQSDTTTTTEPEGIIFDTGEEADSLLSGYVFIFEPTLRDVKIRKVDNPLLDPTGVQMLNIAHRIDGHFYSDLGALGQAHKSLFPYDDITLHMLSRSKTTLQAISLNFQPDVYPAYRNLHNSNLFQTQKPYTLLGYGSSINKDYQISIVHTQNIQPRWNVAFLYNLVSRDGLYTNSEVTNHIMDATTNYYSEDARYQLQASLTFNRIRQQENGGVIDDTTCWDYPRESGIPVNMYAAQNQWRDFKINIHQSFNTVRQFYTVKPLIYSPNDSLLRDSIIGYDTIFPHKPQIINTGVFAIDLNYTRRRRIFSDNRPDSWFYNNATLDTTFWYDSTSHQKIWGEFFWTNDSYMQHRWNNPLILTLGIRPEYNVINYASLTNSKYKYLNLNTFTNIHYNSGKFSITVDAEKTNGGFNRGDYTVSAAVDWGNFRLATLSNSQTADFIFSHYYGIYSWDINHLKKIKHQQVAANYHFMQPDSLYGFLRTLDVKLSTMLIDNNIWLDSNMTPTQNATSGLLTQVSLSTHLRFGWFNINMQQMLQHCTDNEVIRVPLFATKNSIYADMHLFHHALRLQTGIDLRYHTRYKADAWNPVIGAFYRQDDVEIGNFLVTDFWINIQVKRASIYLKACHFNAPLEELMQITPHYFSLPHYPMEGFGLYWGVIWKFFN